MPTALQQLVLNDILNERTRQDEKWGADRTQHPAIWHTILSEEVGEVAQEVLDTTFEDAATDNLYEELIQVAAVAVAWAEAVQRERDTAPQPAATPGA